MVLKSFMNDLDIRFGELFPTEFTLKPYRDALDAEYFWWLKNTLIIGVVNMVGITLPPASVLWVFNALQRQRTVLFDRACNAHASFYLHADPTL